MIILVFILIVIIFSVLLVKYNNKKNSLTNTLELINTIVAKNNINSTKAITISIPKGNSRFIVDELNKKVWYIKAFETGENEIKSYDFKDVYKVELLKDSKTRLVENKFSFFDSYNKKEYVKKLGIRISFNDLAFPNLDILFLNSITSVTLTGLGNIVNSTNEWIQIMQIVINRGKEIV